MAQAGAFGFFVLVVVAGLYLVTVGQVNRQVDLAVDQEFALLEQSYSSGGVRNLNSEIAIRMAAGGVAIYALADSSGNVQSGTVRELPVVPGAESRRLAFPVDVAGEDGAVIRKSARGRIGRLLGGPILLVARDMGDASALVNRINSLMWLAGLVGTMLAVLVGYFTSRQAASRIAQVSRTARDVMGGNLARRAPVTGSNDEFDALAQDINAMLARIENLIGALRTAGDAIAHDLRSPISRLRHQIEAALEAPPDTANDRKALELALSECEQVVATFNSLLRLSNVQSGSGWTFDRVDLSAAANELAEFYTVAAEDQGILLSAEVAAGLEIVADQGLITQALANLVENALKFTPAGGRIVIEAHRRADGRIEAGVLDSGPGVPEADRQRVRQRFVRLDEARTTPGNGLGLSLVEAVAQLHKGSLALEDGLARTQGHGLKAALVLPPAPETAKLPA